MPAKVRDVRETVLRVIRAATTTLREQAGRPGDPTERRRAIATACTREGISPQAYEALVTHDAELERLERAALGEAGAGVADPGPYDAISRESRSGREGDLTKSRWNPPPPMKGASRS